MREDAERVGDWGGGLRGKGGFGCKGLNDPGRRWYGGLRVLGEGDSGGAGGWEQLGEPWARGWGGGKGVGRLLGGEGLARRAG